MEVFMNKYFKLLTGCVISCLAGFSITLLNPISIGVLVTSLGSIYFGYKFMMSE